MDLNSGVDMLIIGCFILFIGIHVINYFRKAKAKREKPLLKLITILIVPCFVGLIAVYNDILDENGNNLSNTITAPIKTKNSLNLSKYLEISEVREKYFICLDISGTIKYPVKKIPDWFNENSFFDLCQQLGVEQEKRDRFQEEAFNNKNTKRSHLIQFKTLELLTLLNDSIYESFQIITFGKSFKVIYPPDENNSFSKATYNDKRHAGNNILDLTFNEKDTNFTNLFNSLLNPHQYDKIRLRDVYTPPSKNIIILSDFEHDVVSHEEKDRKKALNNTAISLETIRESDYNLILFDYNEIQKKTDLIKRIDSVFAKKNTWYKHYNWYQKNQFLFSSYILPIKINMLYSKKAFDESTSHITKLPVNQEDLVWISLENHREWKKGNYSWKLTQDGNDYDCNNNWMPFIPNKKKMITGIRGKKDTLTIKYNGQIPNQFSNTYMRILFPKQKKETLIGIVFTKQLSKNMAILFLITLFFVFTLELFYVLRYLIFKPKNQLQPFKSKLKS